MQLLCRSGGEEDEDVTTEAPTSVYIAV